MQTCRTREKCRPSKTCARSTHAVSETRTHNSDIVAERISQLLDIGTLVYANFERCKLRKKREIENEVSLLDAVSELRMIPTTKKKDSGVRVKGIDNMLIRLSRCCNPVPGDEIVGYITKGRGVSVHRADCVNVLDEESKERIIPVEWESSLSDRKEYNVDIEISGFDRNGLLNEVLQAVSETKTNITAVSGRTDRNKSAAITMSISIYNVSHLQKVVDRIKQIPDIYSVRRLMS